MLNRVMTDGNKIAKIVRIFVDIEHIKKPGDHNLTSNNLTSISHTMSDWEMAIHDVCWVVLSLYKINIQHILLNI